MPIPLVLLHPFPVDHRFWAPLRERLGPDVAVTAPDAPGFGVRPRRAGWTIADWADEVADDIAARSGRAAVCGLSMGGYAALAVAARRPEVLTALILADTRAEADEDAVRQGRQEGIRQIAERGLDAYLAAALPRLTAPGAPAAARDLVARLAAEQPPAAVSDALEALGGRPDRLVDLAGIAVPTLVVVGDQDLPTPVAAARTLAAGIADARLEVVAGAGHMSAVEAPDAVAAAVAGFLRAIRPS